MGLSSALVYQSAQVKEIYAVNPLTITYNGNSPADPMFQITNMLPGDEIIKDFNVENTSPEEISAEMLATKTDEDKDFAQILDIEITDLSGPNIIFEGKLQSLFNSPPINLGSFPAGGDKTFRVKVHFPPSAENEFQNASVVFNIIWRTQLPESQIPPECRHLGNVITNVIEGTNKKDRINGTHESELIIAYDGSDKVDGGAGHDCIVADGGNNRLDGGAGNDVIIAGNGNNRVEGGSSNDKIYLGSGNDRAEGGSGNDEIYGGGGNDRLEGESGDDYLDGGPGHDRLDGDAGTDSCNNGEILSDCEI